MAEKHHKIKGGMVTTLEKLERAVDIWSLLIEIAVALVRITF